jgi:peptidoglycan/LPS O-acetylase OafA/YrhL
MPWLSAIIIYLVTFWILRQNPEWMNNVMRLYKVHLMAFPLGILIGWLRYKPAFSNIKFFLKQSWLVKLIDKPEKPSVLNRVRKKLGPVMYYGLIIISLLFIGYFAYHSDVGQSPGKEQMISIMTMLAIVFLFYFKKIEFRFFSVFGLYSYEIYLLHWPLISRYDLLYTHVPAWLATAMYLIVFMGIGWALKKISSGILKKHRVIKSVVS